MGQNLLETDEFVKFHRSRSVAALAVVAAEGNSSFCTVFELEDEIDAESSHDHHLKHLAKFNFPHKVAVLGSVKGLIFLRKNEVNFDYLYVWNPISREYIELHCFQGFPNPEGVATYGFGVCEMTEGVATYGFGVCEMSGQYKVVRIDADSDCHVYTLGTGSWRRVEGARPFFDYDSCCNNGVFVNGNLHWLVSDSNGTSWISCFDLEAECCSALAVPPFQECESFESLSVLRDCLCFCDSTSGDEIVIWLMKEYGDEQSWTKEYVINLDPEFDTHDYTFVYPMKVFKNGDILMVWDQLLLSFYSNKKKTSQRIDVFDGGINYTDSMLLIPSCISLKSFPIENVISL